MSTAGFAELGEIATFVRGITFKPHDVVQVGTPDSVACMRTKNVQEELDLTDVWAVDGRFVRRSDQMLRQGDILVSSANSWNLVGKCSWIPALPWPSTFGGFVSVLRINSPKVHPRYLYWWFASKRTQALLRSFGQKTTSISNLNIKRCLALRVSLPTLAKQGRIADELDKVAAVRARRLASIELARKLGRATFDEMFGDAAANPRRWPVAALGDVIADGPQNGLYKPSSSYGRGTPILRIDAFYDGEVTDLSSLKRVQVSDAERERYGLRPADVVINRVNSMAYLGKSALVPALAEDTVFESNMMRFRVNPELLVPQYLIHYLQTGFIRSQVEKSAKKAVNQASINQQDVTSFRVNLPPVALQREFARRTTLLGAHVSRLGQHLSRVEVLMESLQSRALVGDP